MQRTSDFFVFATHTQKQKQKNQTKSVMFTLGDGTDSCSLMQDALSMGFRDKEADRWMSSCTCLSLVQGIGYLKAVNNQGEISDEVRKHDHPERHKSTLSPFIEILALQCSVLYCLEVGRRIQWAGYGTL